MVRADRSSSSSDLLPPPLLRAVPLDLPTKNQPSSSRVRLESELASLEYRSAAHLPPTSATPHIPPAPVKRSAAAAGSKGKGKESGASPTGSLNSANSKKTVPVKAKASSKQNRRDREKRQKAMDFQEKLSVKDVGFEDRKVRSPSPLSPSDCWPSRDVQPMLT